MIFSIDPGAKGAMSIFTLDGDYIDTILYKNIYTYYNIIIKFKNINIVIEKVHSMPKQGVVSMFNFGRKLGELEAMCNILQIEPEYITPQNWKKHFNLINKPKNEVCTLVNKLEPNIKCFGPRGGCLDGVADSYLIGRYYIERK